jgi:proteasome lid subunit RPN8/RPN11
LSTTLADEIKDLARKSYPHECGGFLAGKSGPHKEITSVYPLTNTNKSQPNVRFEIDPGEFQEMEDGATGSGLELTVFYHSHPDHPAIPSDFDAERAAGLAPFWPDLSYLIVSVEKARDFEFICWVFNGDRMKFDKEEVVVG